MIKCLYYPISVRYCRRQLKVTSFVLTPPSVKQYLVSIPDLETTVTKTFAESDEHSECYTRYSENKILKTYFPFLQLLPVVINTLYREF